MGNDLTGLVKAYWKSDRFQKMHEIVRLEILNYLTELDEQYFKEYNNHFIRFKENRMKSFESIISKLKRKNSEINIENMEKYIDDISGVRIICYDQKQLYRLVKLIKDSNQYEIYKEKDYIKNPKKNGYVSYHIVFLVPINVDKEKINVKVELQIRTIIMDAWASMDSIVRYKKKKKISDDLEKLINTYSKKSRQMDRLMRSVLEIDEKTSRDKSGR